NNGSKSHLRVSVSGSTGTTDYAQTAAARARGREGWFADRTSPCPGGLGRVDRRLLLCWPRLGEVARDEREDVRVICTVLPADLVAQHAFETSARLPRRHLTGDVVLRDEDLDPLEPEVLERPA